MFQDLHREIMKLNQSEAPCNCEKDTDSDSGNIECAHGEDIFKWLKNNEDNFDIFDVDIEQVEEYYGFNTKFNSGQRVKEFDEEDVEFFQGDRHVLGGVDDPTSAHDS